MEWNVKTVDVHPKEEGHDDVIYNVHWSVSKEDGEYSAIILWYSKHRYI